MSDSNELSQVDLATARNRKIVDTKLFNAVDILATGIFAIEGAAAAAFAGFDLLGVMVVGFTVGLGGGLIRDILLGDLPPAAFRSPARMMVALACALGTFILASTIPDFSTQSLLVLDAIGLALFCVAGAMKAYGYGCNLLVVSILGTITATGGGLIRDVLLSKSPYVLSESVYGTAAFAGALTAGALLKATGNERLSVGSGFVVALAIRLLAIAFDLHLPRIT